MLANNIFLVSNDEVHEEIQFLDFEYGSMNYRAFDFADHFSKFMIDYDAKEYPYFGFKEEDFPSE